MTCANFTRISSLMTELCIQILLFKIFSIETLYARFLTVPNVYNPWYGGLGEHYTKLNISSFQK